MPVGKHSSSNAQPNNSPGMRLLAEKEKRVPDAQPLGQSATFPARDWRRGLRMLGCAAQHCMHPTGAMRR
jgi:hypothetical protein